MWLRSVRSVITLLVVAAACGGSSRAEMSPEAESGRRIFNRAGCASCHGDEGQGTVGPALIGLYGSEVTLDDGSTVVADERAHMPVDHRSLRATGRRLHAEDARRRFER